MEIYLAWPCKIEPDFFDVKAHVTFKYLGDSPFTAEDISNAFDGWDGEFMHGELTWKPAKFGDANVMVLDGWNAKMLEHRAKLVHVRPDDFPEWRPHVTFEKEIFDFIVKHELEVHDVIEEFAPLRFCRRNKP